MVWKQKAGEEISGKAQCYAANLKGEINCKCLFNVGQFAKLVDKLNFNTEIFISGVFDSYQNSEIVMKNTEISYLTKSSTTTSTTPIKPKINWYKKQVAESTPSVNETQNPVIELQKIVADEECNGNPVIGTPKKRSRKD